MNDTPNPCLRVQAPHLAGAHIGHIDALHAVLGLARRIGPRCRSAAWVQSLVVEPILAGTHVLISEQQTSGQWLPVGWLAYALFDAEAESRHMSDPLQPLEPSDWSRGDRLWVLNWMAARGDTARLLPCVRHLFEDLTARSLSRHGPARIKVWRGLHCSAQEAAVFWSRRPPVLEACRKDAVPHTGCTNDWLEGLQSLASGVH